MIKVSNMSFEIKGKKILDNISFEIKDGERIAIVGGNGAGKTTIVESMLNINKKYTGKVEFDFEYKRSPLEKIGVQFQDSNYPVGLTVSDIIEFFSEKSNNVDKEFEKDLIIRFGMKDFLDKDASRISGGQAQKLNVLLSMISKPKVLFMDELTTGLDVFSRNSILDEVESYLEEYKSTLILVTHTSSEIERFIDRVIVIQRGVLIQSISKKEIIKKFKTVEKFLNSLR